MKRQRKNVEKVAQQAERVSEGQKKRAQAFVAPEEAGPTTASDGGSREGDLAATVASLKSKSGSRAQAGPGGGGVLRRGLPHPGGLARGREARQA